jgi:xylulokinase
MDFENFTRGNAYRAAMEGATFALRNGFDAWRAAGLGCSSIRLTGGGSRSASWRQMVADVFELPVEVPLEPEGAALGAALQALWASATAGRQSDLIDLVREHVQMEPGLGAKPDAAAGAAYQEAFARFMHQLDIEVASAANSLSL